jgi:hypothetical protein
MSRTRTVLGRVGMGLRLAVCAAGSFSLLCVPWDTPLIAGRVGALVIGVRIWVVGVALLASAGVWVPGAPPAPSADAPPRAEQDSRTA